jgi:hypothetical protein
MSGSSLRNAVITARNAFSSSGSPKTRNLISPEAFPPPSPPQPATGKMSTAASAASVRILPRTGGNLIRLLIGLSALFLAGCMGSDKGDAPDEAAPLPACAKPQRSIPRPEVLPDNLPVPAGAVFTKVETPFEGQSVVSGVSPGDLDGTRSFYEDRLDEAGYSQGRGESEPGETEALFTGHGVRGGWRANAIPGCDGAVRLTLVVVRT